MLTRKNLIRPFLFTMVAVALIFSFQNALLSSDKDIHELLMLLKEPKEEKRPKSEIYSKDDIVYCAGPGKAAELNNRAAELMKKGQYKEAAELLETGIEADALFFPFRYNLGLCHIHLSQFNPAQVNLEKARDLLPEFSPTYVQMGYVSQRQNRDSEAIQYYRQALKYNRRDINTLVLIGDIFYLRNQVEMAKKYYDACLNLDKKFPNGLLGRAKIHLKRSEYVKAILLFKAIDTTKPYDKAFHYYYAECSFKMQDYKMAASQYEYLLNFRNDKFFLTFSRAYIERKLAISRRFVERGE